MYKIIILILNILLNLDILKVEEFKLDIDPVAPIYWINNKEIFVNEINQSFIYNVEDRGIKNLYMKKSSEIYGSEDGKIYICESNIRARNSIDDYSTRLRKTNLKGDLLLDIELKPTLEVLECREDIILKTVFPIEEKFYIFSDDLYELEEYKSIFLSPNLKSFIYKDSFGSYTINTFKIF